MNPFIVGHMTLLDATSTCTSLHGGNPLILDRYAALLSFLVFNAFADMIPNPAECILPKTSAAKVLSLGEAVFWRYSSSQMQTFSRSPGVVFVVHSR